MKHRLLSLTLLLASLAGCQQQDELVKPLQEVGTANTSGPYVPCDALFTHTQLGWGLPACGNGPGSYRDARFLSVFSQGLVVGIVGEPNTHYIRFTTSQGVEKFLPQLFNKPAALPFSGEDYQIWDKKINLLVGQQVALKLNIYFDLADPNFAQSASNLAYTRISGGLFDGELVIDMMTRTDRALGGDPNLSFVNKNGVTKTYTFAQLSEAVGRINDNFIYGILNLGYLQCPLN